MSSVSPDSAGHESTDHDFTSRRAVSLSGFLLLLCGGGLLLVQWKFTRLFLNWSYSSRLLFFAISVSLVFWGVNEILNGFRFGPANRRGLRLTRHRVMFPREGMLYCLIMSVMFVGSLLGRSNMLMLVFAMMIGPFVLNGGIVFAMLKRTTVGRRVPKRAMAGEMVSVEIALENRKRWLSSRLMAVHDQVENARERLIAAVLFVRVPPREQRSTSYQLRLMQRGKYTFGPIYLSSRFPLGFGERGMIFNVRDEILVYPRIGKLTSKWKRELLAATELVQKREIRKGSFDDEFHRIREYRPGDNPGAIHWRTSARRNELMVREFHPSRDRDLAVLLELWLPERPAAADLARVELAVSLAATICVAQVRETRDAELRVLACGAKLEECACQSGPAGMEALLDTLAVVEAGTAPGVEAMFQAWALGRSAHSRTVFITTRPRTPDGSRNGNGNGNGAARRGTASKLQAKGSLPQEAAHDLQVIHADAEELSQFFRIV
jgi:uncharacterized protein (DUF58 family)